MALILKLYLYNIQKLVLMSFLKTIVSSIIFLLLFQCKTTKQELETPPIKLGKVYYQNWTESIQESGYTVFVPVISNQKNILLDSIYYREKIANLELTENNIYVGRFQSSINTKKDIIMSRNPLIEYGNQVPELPKKIPFELEDSSCVISYKEENRTKYFKISNIIEKQTLN
jgi:hypothetical protein